MSRTLRAGVIGLAAVSAVLSGAGAASAGGVSAPQLKAVGMTLNGLAGKAGTPGVLEPVTGKQSALSPLTGGNPLRQLTGKLPIG
ncbi:hypothetical protein [Amycolatopsis methanolica]|uniref:Secreted protein n=1 Tax=Amycolatopsis methanolica 239 TaxID=1068978 RepID=A0A076MZX7_AMYME|nr:hypothetical protein [Amycolatopsis methanolica]AIJ24466.1 hypothetical protein AMETH_4374 [Amycolatopsis methanolica 239]